MNDNRQDDELITRSEAAKLLNLKPNTLAVWKTKNRYNLPVVIIGGRTVRYWKSDVEKFRDQGLQP